MCQNSGLIYVIGDNYKRSDCKKNDSLLTWNVEGEPGTQGPPGEISNTVRVTNSITNTVQMSAESRLAIEVSCAPGAILLGGGAQAIYSNPDDDYDRDVTLAESYPLNSSTWRAVGLTIGPSSVAPGRMTVTAYAICSQ